MATARVERLPVLPWFEPPAPLGLGHGGGPGYSEDNLSNAELGEIVEIALIEQMGFVSALDPHARKGSFDLVYGEFHAVEARAVTRACNEYKIRLKPKQLAARNAAALAAGLTPTLVMVVIDQPGEDDVRKGYVYWREGIGSFRLNRRSWNFAGWILV
jgi:hypothetical protein